MSIALSDNMSLAVDVAVRLGKDCRQQAVIDRKLASLLLAIRDAGSMQQACDELFCSTRQAQRTLKRFADGSGIRLLEHHGARGVELTEEGRQCIDLYVAARGCVEQIVREHGFPRALPPLNQWPNEADWNHREL